MKDFKKRTLILMLASVVTVTGSFASDNYKNCLMNLEFKPINSHEISVILGTKMQYEGQPVTRKSDASTYVIMLPEFDNSAPTPNLSKVSDSIQSVEIKKMPYSNGNKGYTKILIRTNGNINLNMDTTLYIPSDNPYEIETRISNEDRMREREDALRQTEENARREAELRQRREAREREAQKREAERRRQQQEALKAQEAQRKISETSVQEQEKPVHAESTDVQQKPVAANSIALARANEESHQKSLIGLLVVFIILTSIYFYVKAKDKLTNVMGEKLTIDIDDEPEEKQTKPTRKRNVVRTTNKQDIYSVQDKMPANTYTIQAAGNNEYTKPDEEEVQVVDLDELFKEQVAKKSEEANREEGGDALDDFLSEFSFDDEDLQSKIKETEIEQASAGYDEEVYEKVLQEKGIKFTKDDVMCFRELLQSEISDSVIQNIEQYAVSSPIAPKKPSNKEILENLVTDYAVLQNIYFSAEDIAILKKLISIEIDQDFINDLRTDSKRTDEMAKQISESQPKKPKPTEILTLNVRDMLPNLSEELKKHGKKPIVSNAKPQTVYFSEGYEVSKLSVDIDLTEPSKNKSSIKTDGMLPTEATQVVDQSYSGLVSKLKISGLPDLNDVLTNPKKYREPKPKEYVPDEKSLLASISNVQFKPFDDGTRKFEIINNFDDEEMTEEVPVVDIQKEFSQFSNFEVADEEEQSVYEQSDYDDFEALYRPDYVDLDAEKDKIKNNNTEIVQQEQEQTKQSNQETRKFKISNKLNLIKHEKRKREENTEKFVPQNLARNQQVKPQKERHNKSDELIKKLESAKVVQNIKQHLDESIINKPKVETKVEQKQDNNTSIVRCVIEGTKYDVISSAKIDSMIECHLAKYTNGYAILANNGNNISVVKTYDSLNSEKIFARLSETLADGTPRYLIKIGSNKFIVDVLDGQIRYVVDL